MNVFLSDIYHYLVQIYDINSNIIRIHNRKLENSGDVSFSCSAKNVCNLLKNTLPKFEYKDAPNILQFNNTDREAAVQKLIEASQSWALTISKCVFKKECCYIYLDRITTFKKVLTQVVSEQDKYGSQNLPLSRRFCVTTDYSFEDLSAISLAHLRLLLYRNVIVNILKFNNCCVIEAADVEETDISIKLSLNKTKVAKEGIMACGTVVTQNGTKPAICADQFYKKRTIDMRLMAEHKYGLRLTATSGWQELFEKLGEAAVTIELLQNSRSHPTSININDITASSSKGASFILYNCARLAVLFKEFDRKVAANTYPALPVIDVVDFSLLVHPEEWELLYCYILQFPFIINRCIKDIQSYSVSLHHVCSYLSAMCSAFSVYYRRVRVLTEPRSHLYRVLHARVYLLKAVQQVLHNGLFLLDIQPVKQM